MKLCPYCRRVPGVLRMGQVGSAGKAFISWACETCQAAVDEGVKVHVLMLGLRSGAISMDALAGASRAARSGTR